MAVCCSNEVKQGIIEQDQQQQTKAKSSSFAISAANGKSL
jgi:hypothetical protein